jgi:transcriptional regulator with PAS, ATPase and Fis domain
LTTTFEQFIFGQQNALPNTANLIARGVFVSIKSYIDAACRSKIVDWHALCQSRDRPWSESLLTIILISTRALQESLDTAVEKLERGTTFLAVNCGALTESLLESELFGHVKGAFTGATSYKKGMFESAGKGTIFLDEFGEMSTSMQVRLLRVLQEHKVRPVGSEDSKEINFNARVVVATNRDLRREVAEGRFRQDLYYRVNVFSIWSPALRDRLDDLPLLIDALLTKYVNSSKLVRALRFDSDALGLLQNYSWPGNVRELENLIERLSIDIPPTGLVSAADLSFDFEFNSLIDSDKPREFILSKQLNCLNNSAASVRHLLNRKELDSYQRELAHVGGDVTKAARRLGIKSTTLHMRIKRLKENWPQYPRFEYFNASDS